MGAGQRDRKIACETVIYRNMNEKWILICVTTINKVHIDGSCDLLIRRSIDNLFAEHFWWSGNSRAQSYYKHLSWEISEPNHTASAYAPVLLRAPWSIYVYFSCGNHRTRCLWLSGLLASWHTCKIYREPWDNCDSVW